MNVLHLKKNVELVKMHRVADCWGQPTGVLMNGVNVAALGAVEKY